MNCRKALSRLHAYLDGELPGNLGQQIEEHLHLCASCRSRAEKFRELTNLLDSLPVPPLPEGLAARVMAEAQKAAPFANKRRFSSLLGWQPLRWFVGLSVPLRLTAGAMIVLVCFLGLIMSREISLSRTHPTSTGQIEGLDGFEWFGPTPPVSLGSAYLSQALASFESGEAP
jgi:anti-sigma factor RsiW